MADCSNPNYICGIGFTACGKCPGCLANKRKEWSDRLIIESRYHMYNYFVTLTYSPENLPDDESVHKDDVRKYLKRLRYFAGFLPRHFGCGEYGDESARPHYHICVFSDSDVFDSILKSWNLGRVDVEALTPGRCKYCAGYVVKKMTKDDDPRLLGRNPEFWFGSRRPALGFDLLFELLDKMATDDAFYSMMLTHVYPPCSVKIGGKWVRLPRYIRDKLKILYRFENETQQAIFRSHKRDRDRAILEQIKANLSDVPINMQQMLDLTMDERIRRGEAFKKAYELRHNQRRKL